MSSEFHREYLVRLPLPVAQLYSRAYNAKDARGRHDNAFYLFEALIKLGASVLTAAYLVEVGQGGRRVPALDRLLAQLALPSLGQWVGILREVARYYGERPDAPSLPLGHVWQQLTARHQNQPALLDLYRRIKNGPDGEPAGESGVSLLGLFDSLVQYRNGVFGHGAGRFPSFYEQDMGPRLFPAANELLAEGMLDLLGPRGARLVYITEIRKLDEDRLEVSLDELTGREALRLAPIEIPAAEAERLIPNCVAVTWPGKRHPLRTDPLLVFRGTEQGDDVLFLNRDRNGRQVEYLSYTTGKTERDKGMAPALAKLLSRITGHEVSTDDLEKLSQQSLSETPSVEQLFEPQPIAERQIGDYELLGEIGRGGMGVVYLARQLSLGRLVALKMLPADLAGDEVALARFRREIRALERCDHPHIVKVLASGTLPDGQLYYAMEYVPGADLEMVWRELAGPHREGAASTLGSTTWARAVLAASRKQRSQSGRRKSEIDAEGHVTGDAGATSLERQEIGPAVAELPLPPLPEMPVVVDDDPGGYARRVAQLIRDAALALQEVHDQGIVHRDVKPSNLMLTPDGSRVVLMDFGLAKGQSLTLSASRAAGFLGTLRYAAPEQLAAAKVTVGPAADVRGLGVTLWELLTRQRLFGEAEDEKQLTAWVLNHDVPRLRTVDPTIDRDLETIVIWATERDLDLRISSARELAQQLDVFLEGKPLFDRRECSSRREELFENSGVRGCEIAPYPRVRGVLVGVACACACLSVRGTGVVRSLETWTQDLWFVIRDTRTTQTPIVIVELDGRTLDGLDKPLVMLSPEFGVVVNYLKDRGATAIGIDYLIPANSEQQSMIGPGKPGDADALGQAVARAGNVVLPTLQKGSGRWVEPVYQWLAAHDANSHWTDLGFVNLTLDDDGLARRQLLRAKDSDGTVRPQFALAVWARAQGLPEDWFTTFSLILDGRLLPVDGDERLRINYVGPPGTIPTLSFARVLDAARNNQSLDLDMRGKVVLVGVTDELLPDSHPTPFNAKLMSGVEVHANLIATLGDRAFIETPGWMSNISWVPMIVIGAGLGGAFRRLNVRLGFVATFLLLWVWWGVSLAAFLAGNWRVEIVPLWFLGPLIYAAIFALRSRRTRLMMDSANQGRLRAF